MDDSRCMITSIVSTSQSDSIRTNSDTNTCAIGGICKLPCGYYVAVDYTNQALKLLNSKLCLLDCYSLNPMTPSDVCRTKDKEIAVTISDSENDKHHVQFLTVVEEKLEVTNKFSLEHACEGIAYFDEKLYICSNNAINIYSTNGERIKTLYEDASSDLTDARIAISEDGLKIYLTIPLDDKLVTISNDGTTVAMLQDTEMKYPTGVCVLSDETVLVSGQTSDSVIQVNKEGNRKLATVASGEDGMFQPWALMFDRKTSRLIVGQFHDELTVLELAGTEA